MIEDLNVRIKTICLINENNNLNIKMNYTFNKFILLDI